MAPNVLYAREFPVDISPDIYGNANLTVAHRPSDSIRLIEQQKDFDAYVLGMVMVKDGVSLGEINQVSRQRLELTSNRQKTRGRGRTPDIKSDLQYQNINKELHDRLDYKGGERVFQYLELQGIIGEKPILWFTSQAENSVVKLDSNKQITVALMPADSEEIIKWFRKIGAQVPE